MDVILYFIDFFIHLDQYLPVIIDSFGICAYMIVIIVIFCETGLVVTPVLRAPKYRFVYKIIFFCNSPERITECTIL